MSIELPVMTIVFMLVSALVCAVIPVVLLIVFKKKGADILPFFIGCAVFMLFALVIEGAINYGVSLTAFGKRILENPWSYAIYGGLMAGIFEETGRFIAFTTVLRKRRGNDMNALMYGAGHGGFEAVMTVSVSYAVYIVLMIMYRLGSLENLVPAEAMDQLALLMDQLIASPPTDFLLAIVERCSAIAIHIALSVMVWFGAKSGKKTFLFPLAILLHALVDGILVLLVKLLALPTLAVEGVIAVCAVALILTAFVVWRRNHKKPTETVPPAEVTGS